MKHASCLMPHAMPQNLYGQCGTGTVNLKPLDAPTPIAASASLSFDQVGGAAAATRDWRRKPREVHR